MKKMKFLVTMALVLMTMGVHAEKVTVSSETFKAGGTCNVTVSLEATTTVAAYQMVLYLPEGFSINRYYDEDEEEEVYDIHLSTRHKSGHNLGITKQSDGGYLFLVYANPTKTLKSTPNELFTMVLKAESTVAVSKKASFKNVKVTDADGKDTNVDDVAFDLTYDSPISIVEDGSGYSLTIDEGTIGGSSEAVIPSEILNGEGSVEIAELNYTRELDAPSAGNSDAKIEGNDARLYTICLPDVPATAVNAKYYTLDGASSTTLSFVEVSNSSLAANTPYLVALTSGSDLNESQNVTDVTLMKEVSNSTEKDGYVFKGTLTGLKNDEATAVGAYILQSGNQWGRVTTTNAGAYIPPFRAYIVAKADGARSVLNGVFNEDNITGIQNIRTVNMDGSEQWYDLNGRRIQAPVKGVIIRNGQKVMMK